jgi:hypothetical protein
LVLAERQIWENKMKKLFIAALMAVAMLAIPAQLMAFGMMEFTYTDWRFDFALWNGWSGDNHMYDYASAVDLYEGSCPDGQLGGVWIGTRADLLHQLDWAHTVPDLTVPPDHVTRAKLWIDAWEVDDCDNYVRIEGTWDWDPLNHSFLDNTVYNLSHVDVPGFWNDGRIDVSVFAGERKLRIDGAVLMMDYCQQPPPPSVPEPGTLLLLGLGLTAVGAIRKRSK